MLLWVHWLNDIKFCTEQEHMNKWNFTKVLMHNLHLNIWGYTLKLRRMINIIFILYDILMDGSNMRCQVVVLLWAVWAVRAWKLRFFSTLYFQMCRHTALVSANHRIPYRHTYMEFYWEVWLKHVITILQKNDDYISQIHLTLALQTWRTGQAPNNASKWQIGLTGCLKG